MKKKKAQEIQPPKPVVIDSIAEMESFFAESLEALIPMRGGQRTLLFRGRRLKPVESETVKLLLHRALPPVKPDPDTNEPKYDIESPEYLARAEKFKRQARAFALWRAFPQFRELAAKQGKADLQTPEEIAEWLENQTIDDDVLEHLFAVLTERVVEAQAYMGFTSGNSFPRS